MSGYNPILLAVLLVGFAVIFIILVSSILKKGRVKRGSMIPNSFKIISLLVTSILIILFALLLHPYMASIKNRARLDPINITEQTHLSTWMSAALNHQKKDIEKLGDFNYIVSKMNLISFTCTIFDDEVDSVKFSVLTEEQDSQYNKNFQINNKGENFAPSDLGLQQFMYSGSYVPLTSFMEIIDKLDFQYLIERLGKSTVYNCSLSRKTNNLSADSVGENDLFFYEGNLYNAKGSDLPNLAKATVLSFAGNNSALNVYIAIPSMS